ncbi:right-handed parallel beta-helix repeat-containing protein [Cohnella ginsengisoli]|uniref:Right-handed parallel beta-helix repeat-containing protein n=1 Tax=Cohnella ginsengisoli TaxID=425004 RepID=A0A9X4KMA4_9BACL|nr:right-handed parallel beta-helix repeat-containing protein [Cohnella ginsengisoli]MDG0792120.1 right-handed parallel beta-helix repeat-containing protein [Cohnella ginsengisoli]
MYKKQRSKLVSSMAAFMIALLAIGVVPAPGAQAATNTYHVSKTGSDAADGSSATPFLTIGQCATVMHPGDKCLIDSGTYRETVRPAESGTTGQPITYAAEPGATVVVSGTEEIGGWTLDSGHIYVADLPTGMNSLGDQNQLFIRDGSDVTTLWEARWPNIDDYTLPELKKHVGIASGGSETTLSSDQLTQADGYWVGATMWMRGGDAYDPVSTKISGFDAATHTLSYPKIIQNFDYMWPKQGSTFYLSGLRSELDAPHEWYVDSAARKVYLWAPDGGKPQNVEIKQRLKTFDLSGRSYIHLEGLQTFAGSIPMDGGASYNVLDGITAEYLYFSTESHGTSVAHQLTGGINIGGSNNEVKNSHIAYSTGTLINIDGSNNRIVNNSIHDGSYFAAYDPVVKLSTGSQNLISHNDMYNSGRYILYWNRGSAEIQYNDIHDGMWLSRDGALIYSWGADMGNSEIHHNLIHDSKGTDMSVGLYFDNYASNVVAHHNVIYNNNVGIQLNTPGNYRLIYNNTVANNDVSSVGYWGSAPYDQELYGSRVYNNIFTNAVSLTADTASGYNTVSASGVNFVDPANRNYRLGAGSTAINTGAFIEGITNGYAGAAPDAGAYEYGGADWTVGPDFNHPPNPSYTQIVTPYMNLVKNSGFDGTLDNWLVWTPATTTLEQVSSIAGTTAWKKRGYQNVLKLGKGGGLEQKITGLKSDTDYKFVAWVYNEPGETIIVGVTQYGGADKDVSTKEEKYTRIEVPFHTGPDITSARVRIYKSNAATGFSYADDLGLFETTPFDSGVSDSLLKEVSVNLPNPVFTAGDTGTIPLVGTQQNGQAADLSGADVQFTSSDSSVLRIDGVTGGHASFTALAPGQVTVEAIAVKDGITKAATKVITVFPNGPLAPIGDWSVRTYGTNSRGFATVSGTAYNLIGQGDNVWNASDDFIYFSKPVHVNDPNATVTLTATIDSLGAGDPASVGLMFRAKDTADAKHVHFRTDGTGKVLRYVFRNEESILDAQKPVAEQKYWGSQTGLLLDFQGKSIAAPFQMKLVKTGNNVEGFYLKDGAWVSIGSTTVEFDGGDFLAGIGMYSGAGKLPVKAVISSLDVQIEGDAPPADTTKPTLSVQLDKASVWPPNHKMVTVDAAVTASDEGSGLDSVVLTSIASNAPASAANDIIAAVGTDARSFQVRAEKGRVYTVTYTATDKAGNQTVATATITVPHDQSGK